MQLELIFKIYISVLSFVLGASLGSFLDCLADRYLRGESVLKGRSHCDSCGHPLGVLDLVPVFSYLFLRGKCRYCGEKVPADSLLTEILLGAAFVALFLKFGLSFLTLRYMGLSAVLMGLSIIDLKSYTIPNRFILAGLLIWILSLPLIAGSWDALLPELGWSLAGAFGLFGFMLGLSLLFDKLSGKDSLGGGDLKLFFLMGLYLKPAVSCFALLLSCVLGLLFSAVMKKKRIPFGPAISLALFLALFVGREVVMWYSSLI